MVKGAQDAVGPWPGEQPLHVAVRMEGLHEKNIPHSRVPRVLHSTESFTVLLESVGLNYR